MKRILCRTLLVLTISVVAVSAPTASQANASPNNSNQALSNTARREIVTKIAAVVAQEYVHADVAARAADALLSTMRSGGYDNARTIADLAQQLTADLYGQSKDKHLAVTLAPNTIKDAPPASRAEAVRRSNGGVQRVEVLAANVGYLNLTSFWRLDEARDPLVDALRLLSRSDAVIVDVRANGGGSPETVAFLVGHLLNERGTPLFDVVSRAGKRVRYATPADVGVDKPKRPLYVLTSSRTFSAGEGFAFLLQERGLAEVVGEVTAGAANPGSSHPVSEGLTVTVPNGVVQTAHSGRNWEGSGVTPTMLVPAADALDVAHRRAVQRLGRTP